MTILAKKLSKTQAIANLNKALGTMTPKCRDQTERWSQPVSDAKAQMMCHGCPLLLECGDYATVDARGTGAVWAGKYYPEIEED